MLKHYKRPWWALAMQLPALKTTLKENHQLHQKQFLIEGEPVLRSLAWVTYGPLMAAVGVVMMGILAWAMNISQQETGGKILFACLMFAVPGLFWGIGGALANLLTQRQLQKQALSHHERVTITLNVEKREIQVNQERPFQFSDIVSFKLVSDAGFDYEPTETANPQTHLILETTHGQITLLKKEMGTAQQKQQLISKLQAIIKPNDAYSGDGTGNNLKE